MELKELSEKIYQNNIEKGFWDKERNVGEMLMLIVSELSEALEAHRKSRYANIPKFEEDKNGSPFHAVAIFKQAFEENIKDSFEDEIADAVIRLLDISKGLGIDLEKHIELKMQYNATRPKMHGKLY